MQPQQWTTARYGRRRNDSYFHHQPRFDSRGRERADRGKDGALPVPQRWGEQGPSLVPNRNPNGMTFNLNYTNL